MSNTETNILVLVNKTIAISFKGKGKHIFVHFEFIENVHLSVLINAET